MNTVVKTKRCSRCKRRLSINKFGKCKSSPDNLYYWCKLCVSEYSKQWYLAHHQQSLKQMKEYNQTKAGKASARKTHLKYNYNLTLEQYDKLLKKQKGCCGICNKPQSNFKKRFAVDHNHQTGKIRGLLYRECNRQLGIVTGWYENNKKNINQYLKGKK